MQGRTDFYIHPSRGKTTRYLERKRANLQGFSAADKVVGKATAFLYALLNVQAVYANVISKAALETLQKSQIFVEYGEIVEHIINREKSGVCPFESAVLDIDDTENAYLAIRQKMDELGIMI